MSNFDEYIARQLEEIDISEYVKDEIRSRVGDEIQRQITIGVKEKVTEIINAEIRIVLNKPVATDDGWGKKESYNNFESLFKKVFSERLAGEWEMKKAIENQVKSKVAELFEKNFREVATKIADGLITAQPKA